MRCFMSTIFTRCAQRHAAFALGQNCTYNIRLHTICFGPHCRFLFHLVVHHTSQAEPGCFPVATMLQQHVNHVARRPATGRGHVLSQNECSGHQIGAGKQRLMPCSIHRCVRVAAAAKVASRSGASTLIKICGVTNPEDAMLAAEAGADFIGMIMWPKAKRSVSDDTAQQIAQVATKLGARPVGVFVDEDAATIASRCAKAGIEIAQLHGDGARSSLQSLPPGLQVVYVMHATPEGEMQTPSPSGSAADWVLIDGLQGGSGQTLDWNKLQPPAEHAKECWMLAGGLNPGNVAAAISLSRPTAVDVSSGVCGPDGLKKDLEKIRAFIAAVKGAA